MTIQHALLVVDEAALSVCGSFMQGCRGHTVSSISPMQARKLIKELQAQVAAAEAAAALDACLSRRPCGSAVLKAAIAKGEAAAQSLNTGSLLSSSGSGSSSAGNVSGLLRTSNSSSSNPQPSTAFANQATVGSSSSTVSSSTSGCMVFSEALLQRLSAAKKRLDVEKAAEALHKASLSCRAVADLAKLEAAILNARKVGAEDVSPEEYRAASELRARLTAAAKVRAQLDAALRALLAGAAPAAARSRQLDELVAPVEAAMQEAARWAGDTVVGDDGGWMESSRAGWGALGAVVLSCCVPSVAAVIRDVDG